MPAVEENAPAVRVRDVWFAYDQRPVIEEANFIIRQGDFVSVVGPNGGGKTTLLRLLLGLLHPQRGEIRIFGQRPEQGRRYIGYTPQHALHDLRFPITVSEVVHMGRLGFTPGPFCGRKDREEVLRALEEVDIAHLARRSYADLSGGQRQRVLIARALCGQPRLLLMDEPTANVDTTTEQKLVGLLHELNQRMTIVLVSHDLAFVSQAVEQAICVNRRVAVHPTSTLSQAALSEIYGDTVRLIRHDHCLDGEEGCE